MRAKKITKWGCRIAAVILATLLLLIGSFTYVTRYKITDIDTATSEDGQHEVIYQAVGEPERTLDEPTADFSELVVENENGESVFAIPIENLIECYNSVYRQTHETGYLNSTNSENWYCYDELSPCFGYESVRYKFSADKTVWPMPTISIYISDKDEVYEIRLTFDDHGYQEQFHELFRELCIYMEKMMMPELSAMETKAMFETLYAQSDDNFFGNHPAFDDPERPVINAVYQYNNIGMYCFYGSGNIEICFVPLTSGSVCFLEKNGTPLLDWQVSD